MDFLTFKEVWPRHNRASRTPQALGKWHRAFCGVLIRWGFTWERGICPGKGDSPGKRGILLAGHGQLTLPSPLHSHRATAWTTCRWNTKWMGQENPKLTCYLGKITLKTAVAFQIFGPKAGFQLCFALDPTVTNFCTTPKIGKISILGDIQTEQQKTMGDMPERWPCFEERIGWGGLERSFLI